MVIVKRWLIALGLALVLLNHEAVVSAEKRSFKHPAKRPTRALIVAPARTVFSLAATNPLITRSLEEPVRYHLRLPSPSSIPHTVALSPGFLKEDFNTVISERHRPPAGLVTLDPPAFHVTPEGIPPRVSEPTVMRTPLTILSF